MRQFMKGIVGNRALCEKLCLDVLSDRLSHACVIEGPKGTGKHTIAKYVAAALACTEKGSKEGAFPCTECAGCRKVLEGKAPDVITVGCEGKATMGVDSVRFLREDVRTVPNDLDHKVYIIEDADRMTVQAQNAFLLTLEEPPAFVRFMLLCENSELLLETIRSRAPVLRTEPVDNGEFDSYLCLTDRRAAQMKMTSPKEYAELIMAAKHGIGTALAYLDPKAFTPVLEMRRLATELLSAALGGARHVLPLLSRFSQKRDILSTQLLCLAEAIHDLVLLKRSDSAPLAFFSDREKAIELSDSFSVSFLYDLESAVMCAIDNNAKNANVRLTLIKLASDGGLI